MKPLKLFFNSFKPRKNFYKVLLIDIVVLLVLFGAVNLLSVRSNLSYADAKESISVLEQVKLGAASNVDVKYHAGRVNSFLKDMFSGFVMFILFAFVFWVATRAYVWTLVLDKKFSWRFLGRFSLLNLGWQIVNLFLWLFFLLVVSLLGKLVQAWAYSFSSKFLVYLIIAGVSFLVLIPLALVLVNLNNLLLLYFTRFRKISKAFVYTFTFMFTKVHKVIVPYLLVGLVFFVLSLVIIPLAFSQVMYLYASAIIMAAILAWMKFYLVDLEKALG